MFTNTNTRRKIGAGLAAMMLVLSVFAGGAFAHDIVLVSDDTDTDWNGYTVDGTATVANGTIEITDGSAIRKNVTVGTDEISTVDLHVPSSMDDGAGFSVGLYNPADGSTIQSTSFTDEDVNSDGVVTVSLAGNAATSQDVELAISAGATLNQSLTLDKVIVNAGTNTAPAADAGTDQTVVVDENVTLDASASSDSDADSLTYEWDVDGDGNYELTGQTATHSYPVEMSQTVTLRVTDQHGATSTDSMVVTVESANSAPTADAAANQSVDTGANVTFDGSASSDPDGDTLTYSWDFDGDGTEDATGVSPVHAYSTAGEYTATLTVTDADGATSTDTVTVTVSDATYATSFNVTDSDGVAVENATISIMDSTDSEVASLTTDANGSAVADLADGDYNYTISASGYDDFSNSFTVSGSSATIDASMTETTTTTTDDGTGGGFIPSGGTPALIVLILLLAGGAVALKPEE